MWTNAEPGTPSWCPHGWQEPKFLGCCLLAPVSMLAGLWIRGREDLNTGTELWEEGVLKMLLAAGEAPLVMEM